ncbi:NAD(P)H-hydrate dehydratase [Roseicyclus persicicus]|uniref:Bifunctional NAD(P)H-hydrate repair enzyme n=1 Tax=Roseicyclus persicicus TaxID=2650661 RepID=A0A7X6JXJ1_9RHOB|nr:NAD(P)H-hydrate dehydratase [Roseibacterium persicicum]NKX44835.1 NAD(P)H-hydrate dehydratase [Roseibacterium persicicum]
MDETESGGRAELLTAAQMRAAERAAIDGGSVTGLQLMERAGAGVVAAALAERPALAEGAHRALVLCGPGNNGGDGFVIARLLAARGWTVDVHLMGDPDRLPPDARANHDAWARTGPVQPMAAARDAAPPDLVVDAVFGTGIGRPLPTGLEQVLDAVRGARDSDPGRSLTVAVDVPSGLCADSGRPLGRPLPADLTVTFHRAKPGHVLDRGPALCGRLVIADIGLPDAPVPGAVRWIGPWAARRTAKTGGHKYRHGHALVVAGGFGRTGAARLAARAALRVGAGLVTVAAPAAAMPECAAQLTAIMLRQADGSNDLCDLLADDRINAVCLGPGLAPEGAGQTEARAMVLTALQMRSLAKGRGIVLDADALTLFSWPPEKREKLLAEITAAGGCVMTPHDGEFARLFPDLASRLEAEPGGGPAWSRLDAARAAAARAGCVVLLKGPDTVIAAPDGTAAIHAAAYDRAAPWLATAGAGDVLAGLIAGLIARGHAPFDAACAAAWLHVEAARTFGPGLIAEDLPEALPGVLRPLGA